MDRAMMGYLLATISKTLGMPVEELERHRDLAYLTPAFDFLDLDE